jgi:phi LC3 family holin
MNVNWKVRIKNKAFWVALIPALIVLVHAVANVFGYSLDLSELGDKLIAVVEAVFVLLGILGIVIDPTTAGIKDSDRALTYNEPRE